MITGNSNEERQYVIYNCHTVGLVQAKYCSSFGYEAMYGIERGSVRQIFQQLVSTKIYFGQIKIYIKYK